MYLIFSVFCLSAPESVICIASGQIQIDSVKVLDGGDDGQCPSVEKGERDLGMKYANLLIHWYHPRFAMAHQDGGVLLLST